MYEPTALTLSEYDQLITTTIDTKKKIYLDNKMATVAEQSLFFLSIIIFYFHQGIPVRA